MSGGTGERGNGGTRPGGIAITEEREKRIDFTHSYFHTGLGILVPKDCSLSALTFIRSLLTSDRLKVLGYMAIFMVLAGHFIWLVERRNQSSKKSFAPRYFPGVLEGMYWAVVTAGTSEEYVSRMNCVVYPFERIEIAYKWLQMGAMEAVVYDRPNLMYYARTQGNGQVQVVGKTFSPQDYGIAAPQGSPFREKINRTILAMIESGEMEEIRTRWFGSEP